jgi:hypothetical protein
MQIMRVRQLVNHLTPTRRGITDEYTLCNTSKDDQFDIIFIGYPYRPNLHVYDFDGAELPIYSNEFIRNYLQQQGDSESLAMINDINSGKTYIQWIRLPDDRPIHPGENRVINFSYVDRDPPTVLPLKRSIFGIPFFTLEQVIPPNVGRSHHITVQPPLDFEMEVTDRQFMELTNAGNWITTTEPNRYRENIRDELLDFTIPSSNKAIRFKTDYSIVPGKDEQNLFRSVVFIPLLTSIAVLFIAIGLFDEIPVLAPVVAFVKSGAAAFSAGVFILCIGFIGLVTNPLTHRTKLFLLAPLLVSAAIAVISNHFG